AVFGHLTEAEPTPPQPLGDDLFKPHKSPTADEQDIARVEGDAGLHRVLVAALRWHRGDRPFEKLQKDVLDAQPQIFEARATPLDFVDLVNVDDATLSSVHVAFGSQDQ